MRKLRKFLQAVLPLLGGVLLLYSAVAVPSLQRQFVILGIGFAVLLLGAWRLFHWLLPNEREYVALRSEVDEFLALVRQLNTSSIEAKTKPASRHFQAIQDLQQEMHVSVDRMVGLAGVTPASSASSPLSAQPEAEKTLIS